MRILISGGRGMLARTLAARLGTHADHVLAAPGREELDITDPLSVGRVFADFQPDVVLHCAAYTKVDQCESEPELASQVNVAGSAHVAAACQQAGARLIAFSTDYVFDGHSGPYSEFSRPTGGLNVYGQTKWAGECAIRLNCPNHLIARVSWLYGPGGPSFVHTMMRLNREGRPLVRVVNDQKGNPTSTLSVACAIEELLDHPEITGTIHLTCEGEATWYDLAKAVFALTGREQKVEPCTSAEYPLPAARPANSCLLKERLKLCHLRPMPHWQTALKDFLASEFPDCFRETSQGAAS
ncbi:MAG TPA: dTDP-4-dehydrorhamnose reductase [Candidatus Desulfovibrio intestinipullorum]|uniref:dTDP-4-dehydrorhamnose reductase n=1 Tax=Candidatus Desulfovibrio intestinipullorum TaxID=2838536 RepID=A0A9D1TP15_9BACT|nr:dTDP-4-dehydrorhamnose reductase [Candidatus Desulfovibrio intestinipullorum]